jgi:hypothetical protein
MAIIEDYLLELPDRVAMATAGLALSEETMRCSIEWNGVSDIPCVGGPEVDGEKLTDGGFVPVRKVKISVRNVSFPDGIGFPQKQQIVRYKRAENATVTPYRIVEITNHWDAWMELRCEDVHRGA